MRVVVAGGGIGGLALAQGLRRRGVGVTVIERDVDLAATGGYKLHLGPAAVDALRELVPSGLFDRIRAASVATDGFALAMRDHRGRLLVRAHESAEGISLDIDRRTLRVLLAEELEGAVRGGAEAVHFEEGAAGVALELRDGTTLEGDALVIADGAGSKLVHALAGGPTSFPTGLMGIAGRTSISELSDATRELLRGDQMLAIGPGGAGLFAAWHEPTGGESTFRTSFGAIEPVIIWGLIAPASEARDRSGPEATGGTLHELAAHVLTRRHWTPTLIDVPAQAMPESIATFRFVAADPRRIAPWTPRRVTAIGDAAHTMPPTGGRGAATAIVDAADHADRLTHAARGRATVASSLASGAARMRTVAAPAVRESLEPVRWIRASAHPIGRRVVAAALPTASVVTAVLRGVAGRAAPS